MTIGLRFSKYGNDPVDNVQYTYLLKYATATRLEIVNNVNRILSESITI